MYFVVFVLSAGFGLALGFYAGLTAKDTVKKERGETCRKRRR
jgi:hypothetical protein